MSKIATVTAPICLFLLAACEPRERAVVDGLLRNSWSQLSDREYIRTRGIGLPPPNAVGKAQRRALSRVAALAAARLEMLATIKGVKISGSLTVAVAMVQDSRIEEIANRVVRGAEERSAEWTSEDACVITLELRRSEVRRLIEEDQRWEPPTERDLYEAEQRKLEVERLRLERDRQPAASVRVVYEPSLVRGPSPTTTLLLGLAVPGLGTLYAGDENAGRGWYQMAFSLGLASVGGYFFNPHEVGETMSDGTRRRERNEAVGYVFFGLAGVLHVSSALDGYRSARQQSGHYELRPVRGGMQMSYSHRF